MGALSAGAALVDYHKWAAYILGTDLLAFPEAGA